MNVLQPVSSIMSTDLKTVMPSDELGKIKQLFETHNIHHIPVVRYQEIVGIVSKSDFLHYLHGFRTSQHGDNLIEEVRLKAWKAEDIMSDKLVKVEASDPIRTVLDLFKLNRFHAIPVVDDNKLVGIITTYDIINAISEEPIDLSDYNTSKQ